MLASKSLRRAMCASLLIGLTGACQMAPPGSTPVDPSATPATASTPPADPAAGFVDSFDGTALDPARWTLFEQTGVAVVRDGALELLNTSRQPNFPYVLTKAGLFPESGPFTFEVVYQFRSEGGEWVSMCLDYMPNETPGVEALTVPLLRLDKSLAGLKLMVDLPGNAIAVDAAAGAVPHAWHRLRVAFDGEKNYDVTLDGQSLARFETPRRPSRFWVGQYPQGRAVHAIWPRLALDEVRVGR